MSEYAHPEALVSTGWVADELLFWHDTGSGAHFVPSGPWVEPMPHADSPATKRRFWSLVERSGLGAQLTRIAPRPATEADLLRLHTPAYVEKVRALSAANGGEAGIDAFRAAPQGFDAVITDLGMPYVDGRKVAEAVKADGPSTLVILLTGWGQRLMADGEVPTHVDRVLSKPPRLRELRTALAEAVRYASPATDDDSTREKS